MSKRYPGGIVSAVFKPLDPHGDTNSLYVWGSGLIGEMGLNDLSGRSSPVLIDSGVTWSKVFGSASANWRLAIKQNGTMWAWGQNDDGQLGNNTTSKRSSPTQIGTLTTWVTGTVGGSSGGSTAAIKTDGSLWTWGKSQYGELGSNSVASRSSPVQVGGTPAAATSWSEVSEGMGYHTAIIGTDSSLWTFGYNDYGQLGHTNTVSRSSPVQVGTDTNWSAAAIGGSFTLAIKSGALWGWGDGTTPDTSNTSRSSPIQVGSLTTWSKIAAGSAFGAAIKTDGSLWTWGTNYMGTLGLNLGNAADKSSPTQVGGLYTWSSVAAGRKQTFAVKTDGTLWSFGYNNYGQLGNNTIANTSSPVQIGSDTNWSKVNAGYFTTFAIKTNGTLWSWGRNDDGQLGQNNLVNKSSPVQIGSLSTWSNIAGNYSCVATKTDGTLWSWSSNDVGNLGLNDTVPRSSPVQIGSDTDWSKLGSGLKTNAAINTAGELYLFGDNDFGQVGINSVADVSSPVQVGAQIYGWSLVSRGGYVSAAIRADGTMWTWGRNQAGQLGQNNAILRSSPVQVGTDTNWSKVSVAANGILAIKTDNSLWVWGYQDQGVLGLNDTVPRSSPVQVGSTTVWSLISATRYHAGAIRTNGTLWTWGKSSDYGQLGLDDRVNRSSPVQVGSDTDWGIVSAGTNTVAATKTIGTLYIWGDGRHGEMGNNTVVSRSSPIQVGAITSWADVSVGSDDSAQNIFAISSIQF